MTTTADLLSIVVRLVCRRGNVLLAVIIVPVACAFVAFAVVATVFLRRQLTRAETKRLQLTVKLSGLATDEEVLPVTTCKRSTTLLLQQTTTTAAAAATTHSAIIFNGSILPYDQIRRHISR